jgi:hypothetical protein
LDRVDELYVKIAGFRAHANTDTTYIVDGAPRIVAVKIEKCVSICPVGVDTQEAFAQGNEDGYMEERIRGQLMDLDLVDKEQTTEKFMDMNG